MLSLILLIFAFVLFVIAAFWKPVPELRLVAAGLACWVLSVILAGHNL